MKIDVDARGPLRDFPKLVDWMRTYSDLPRVWPDEGYLDGIALDVDTFSRHMAVELAGITAKTAFTDALRVMGVDKPIDWTHVRIVYVDANGEQLFRFRGLPPRDVLPAELWPADVAALYDATANSSGIVRDGEQGGIL